MEKTKKYCIIINIILLLWFTLDMIGVYFGEQYLVTRAWQEDGIFWLIFVIAFLLFIFKEKIGKKVLTIWLFLWLVTQFLSHEWFTIMGNAESKIAYFENAIPFIPSKTIYIPDLYHTVLHVLILIAFTMTLRYWLKTRNSNKHVTISK